MSDGSVRECPTCSHKWTFQPGEEVHNFCPRDGTKLVSPEEVERQRQAVESQSRLPLSVEGPGESPGSNPLNCFFSGMVPG